MISQKAPTPALSNLKIFVLKISNTVEEKRIWEVDLEVGYVAFHFNQTSHGGGMRSMFVDNINITRCFVQRKRCTQVKISSHIQKIM